MTTGLVGQNQVTTFTTPVNGTSPIDANQVRGNDNTIKTSYDAHDSDPSIHLQSSTAAARPVAATAGVGAKWIDNDTYRVYYSDGSAWHEVAYLSTSGGTVSGNLVVTGTLESDGNFSVNTNKFTVAAASGNTVIAGTLGVVGLLTTNAGILNTGTVLARSESSFGSRPSGSAGVGVEVGMVGSVGTVQSWNATGAALAALNVQGSTIALTGAVTGSSTITGTRLIGGTDIASAVAPGTFSDGTAPANNAYSSANVFSLLVSKTASATTGSVVTSEVYHKQTGANAAGSTIATFSYIDSAHTSGTTLINIANVASIEATGNGGTTTTLGCYRTQAVIGTGATVTTLPLVDVRAPANSGTITTLIGLDVQSMTAGGTNYAIRTHTGLVQLGDALEFTAAATPATGTNVRFGNAVQSTIGANGAAIALTANPLGYLVIYVGVLKCIIPYYTA